MSADMAAWAGVILVALGMVCGIIAWLFKTGIAPLKVVIDNNTSALNLALSTLGKHDEKIEYHEIRLNTIETTHEVLGCGKK